ncbi:hypothetical protein CHARACLAT_028083 [Characodon lateralis]|uniref:Uncharacterized protein n=1 Tax=Characodon lateralis TaxID=208331 RepID=A0ABU7CU16_9TELE|nr:hypothetical protein [Characodon lateralis]
MLEGFSALSVSAAEARIVLDHRGTISVGGFWRDACVADFFLHCECGLWVCTESFPTSNPRFMVCLDRRSSVKENMTHLNFVKGLQPEIGSLCTSLEHRSRLP